MDTEKIRKTIEKIEEEIKATPYHKGTEHHIGQLKAKIAKLRKQLQVESKKKGKGLGFAIKKEGDATVVLVGLPSVGKSTLLNKLTGTKSKVGFYPFTTLEVIPGMLKYKGANIQIFDIPGLIKGAIEGKGKGKEVLSVVSVADLLLMMASVENLQGFKIMERELYSVEAGMNEKKPVIKILSKIDLLSKKQLKGIRKRFGKDCLFVSAKKDIGIERLKEEIFKKLNLIRIYLRKSQKAASEKEPLICKKEVTVLEAAKKISEKLAHEIKGARIKGPSAKYSNQLVGLHHMLSDKDKVFFVKKSGRFEKTLE